MTPIVIPSTKSQYSYTCHLRPVITFVNGRWYRGTSFFWRPWNLGSHFSRIFKSICRCIFYLHWCQHAFGWIAYMCYFNLYRVQKFGIFFIFVKILKFHDWKPIIIFSKYSWGTPCSVTMHFRFHCIELFYKTVKNAKSWSEGKSSQYLKIVINRSNSENVH